MSVTRTAGKASHDCSTCWSVTGSFSNTVGLHEERASIVIHNMFLVTLYTTISSDTQAILIQFFLHNVCREENMRAGSSQRTRSVFVSSHIRTRAEENRTSHYLRRGGSARRVKRHCGSAVSLRPVPGPPSRFSLLRDPEARVCGEEEAEEEKPSGFFLPFCGIYFASSETAFSCSYRFE